MARPSSLSLAATSRAGVVDLDLLVDRLDDPVLVDVERPAIGESARRIDDPVVLGHGLVGIAEDGVVEVERLGEFFVVIRRVDAGCEIGDLEIVELFAVFTKRLAFLGAARRVNALGNQAITTADFPLNCSSVYVLPSDPCSEKAGARSPTFNSAAAAAATMNTASTPRLSVATLFPALRDIRTSSRFALIVNVPGVSAARDLISKPNSPSGPPQPTRSALRDRRMEAHLRTVLAVCLLSSLAPVPEDISREALLLAASARHDARLECDFEILMRPLVLFFDYSSWQEVVVAFAPPDL